MTTIQVVMDNRHAKFIRPYPWEQLRELFAYQPPGWRFMPKVKMGLWDGFIRCLRYDKVPTGLFLAMKDEVEKKLGVQFSIENKCLPVLFRPINDGDERDYQLKCVAAMKQAAQTGGGLVLCATGTGKTRMAGMFLKSLIGQAVFVVDELTLLEQARQELHQVTGEEIGVVGHSEFRPQRITVATIQTLHLHQRRIDFVRWVKTLDVMIIDEIHVMLNRRQDAVVESIRPFAVFGLTATLPLQQTHTAMRAYALTGPVIFSYSLEQGTTEGHLTSGVVVQLSVPSLEDFKKEVWTDAYRRCVIQNVKRNAAVEQLTRAVLAENRSAILLVEWIGHLKEFSRRLKDIPHRLVYGAVEVEDRMAAKQDFDAKEVKLIITNKVFKKGVNLRAVDCIIDAAGLKSKTDCIQKFGRGVRLAEGKIALAYFDIADTLGRHGEASDSRYKAFHKQGIKVYQVPYEEKLLPRIVQRAIQLANIRGIDNAKKVDQKKTKVRRRAEKRQGAPASHRHESHSEDPAVSMEAGMGGVQATATGYADVDRRGRLVSGGSM